MFEFFFQVGYPPIIPPTPHWDPATYIYGEVAGGLALIIIWCCCYWRCRGSRDVARERVAEGQPVSSL